MTHVLRNWLRSSVPQRFRGSSRGVFACEGPQRHWTWQQCISGPRSAVEGRQEIWGISNEKRVWPAYRCLQWVSLFAFGIIQLALYGLCHFKYQPNEEWICHNPYEAAESSQSQEQSVDLRSSCLAKKGVVRKICEQLESWITLVYIYIYTYTLHI